MSSRIRESSNRTPISEQEVRELMEYRIIEVIENEKWVNELETEVREAIAEGWKPIGGVSTRPYGLTYTQATQVMVKE